jgi:LPPG:FO 2-phospho-L-lactate transferase
VRVTVLCGGFGAARFLSGLRQVPGLELTCIVNTADDLDYAGVHVSPDVDTVCYALAQRFDEERGWGLIGDTFHNQDAQRRYGGGWFGVGDLDLATHLRRTDLLARGATLSEAVDDLTGALGVAARVVPMSDDPVRTVVVSDSGDRLPFQEYLVKHRAVPAVAAVEYAGLDGAAPAPGVLPAIAGAELVVIAPSNPIASIGPILALPGVREAVTTQRQAAVAVAPIVTGQAPSTGPERGRAVVREAFMASRGLPHRAASAAAAYAGAVGRFVLDVRDAGERPEIEALGYEVLLADTLAGPDGRAELARAVVAFGAGAAANA